MLVKQVFQLFNAGLMHVYIKNEPIMTMYLSKQKSTDLMAGNWSFWFGLGIYFGWASLCAHCVFQAVLCFDHWLRATATTNVQEIHHPTLARSFCILQTISKRNTHNNVYIHSPSQLCKEKHPQPITQTLTRYSINPLKNTPSEWPKKKTTPPSQ